MKAGAIHTIGIGLWLGMNLPHKVDHRNASLVLIAGFDPIDLAREVVGCAVGEGHLLLRFNTNNLRTNR
jgi:hypothetical protein